MSHRGHASVEIPTFQCPLMALDWKDDVHDVTCILMNRPARRRRRRVGWRWRQGGEDGGRLSRHLGDTEHWRRGSNMGEHSFRRNYFLFFFKKSKGNVNVLSDISVAVLMLSESNPSNGESDAKSGCGVAPTFASLSSSQKHT